MVKEKEKGREGKGKRKEEEEAMKEEKEVGGIERKKRGGEGRGCECIEDPHKPSEDVSKDI